MAWFHRHRWVVRGVQNLQRITRHATLGEMSSPITEILERCDCGAIRTLTVDGTWSLEQMNPPPGQVEADKDFFRRLGVKI
jgi:hypothetical protein